jgi:succinate dehydrogenase / fumarate reductase iron-sulfur subunit
MAARQISVERFNSDAGPEPYWQIYTVDIGDNQTVLDALLIVADRIDPTLAFRRTCRSGICGSCAGRVNGRACLLCQLSISEAADDRPDARVSIQPLQGFKVLRDLVVDMDPFFEEFDRAGAWLIPKPQYDGVLSAQVASSLWPAMSCVMCGICARGQQSVASPHPAVVARVLTLASDPRDATGPDRLRQLGTPPDRHFAEWLKAVCPKDVDVRGLVE